MSSSCFTRHFLTGYWDSVAVKISTRTNEHGSVCGPPVYCHPNLHHAHPSMPPSSPLNPQLLEGQRNDAAHPIVPGLLPWDVHIGAVRAIVVKLAGAGNTRFQTYSRHCTFLLRRNCRRLHCNCRHLHRNCRHHHCNCHLRTNLWPYLSIRMSTCLK